MTDVDEIRRQMAQIRHDMHYDVSHVVGDVEEAMDWRAIMRRHPYIVVGAGLAAGYLLVPKRRREPERWADRDARAPQPFLERPTAPAKPAKPPKSLTKKAMGWAAGMLWPLVSQSVQNYAAAWLENQIKQQMHAQAQGSPFQAAPQGPGGPGGPGAGDEFVYRMPRRG